MKRNAALTLTLAALSGLADSSSRLALARRRFLPIDSGFAQAELMNTVGVL